MSNKYLTAPNIHSTTSISDKKAITATDIELGTTVRRALDVNIAAASGNYLAKFNWKSYDYDEPTTTTERYRFYSESALAGDLLATFTFTYDDSSKSTPPSGSWS